MRMSQMLERANGNTQTEITTTEETQVEVDTKAEEEAKAAEDAAIQAEINALKSLAGI